MKGSTFAKEDKKRDSKHEGRTIILTLENFNLRQSTPEVNVDSEDEDTRPPRAPKRRRVALCARGDALVNASSVA